MTDIRAEGTEPAGDDDRLPWLEAADEDDDDGGPSAAKLIAFVVIGLVAIGLIVGGLFWMGNRSGGADGEPELIAAPEGDYKVKPDDPGGMKVKGEGDTQFAASEGQQPKGAIDTSRVPEAPVTKAPVAPAGQPKAAPRPAPAAPAAPGPAPAAPAAGGSQTIQLGAFDSQAQANTAWKALAGRFSYLAPLNQSVMTAKVGGRTYYRLRASGAGARDICRRLEVAGESCIVIN
jgi:cell division septation protein DedD